MPTIVVLGATGFIGGHFLFRLLTSSPSSLSGLNPNVIALTSSPDKAKTLEEWQKELPSSMPFEVRVAARGKEWYEETRKIAAEADLVVQAATSDDLELTKAINAGLEQAKKNGLAGKLLHLSGVQLIESAPLGYNVPTAIFDDTDEEQLAAIPDSAAHRLIDLEIVNAISSGKIAGSIVCPAQVWGVGEGPTAPTSGQITDVVTKSIYNGAGVYVGSGEAEWINVEVTDLCELMLTLSAHELRTPYPSPPPAPHSTFYFASHPVLHTWAGLASAVGEALKSKGIVDSAEPKSVACPPYDSKQKGVRVEDAERSENDKEVDASTPSWPCRTNCRCVSSRARQQFGWRAKRAFDHEAMKKDALHVIDVLAKSPGIDALRKN